MAAMAAGCRRGAEAAPAGRSREHDRARWSTRPWSGRCVRAKCRSTNWSAPSARPRSRSRRRRRRQPLPPKPEVKAVKAEARAKAEQARRRGRDAGGRQGRQPVDPRQCRHARAPDDHGLGAGADPQPAARDRRRHEDTEFKVPLQRLSNVTAELQEGVMKTRMQPIGNAWQKLPRIVRDLSGELGKQIELEMHGADTELDRQVLDLIKDPLTHMVRNSADHGLETPAERARRRQAASRAPSASPPITRAATSSSASPTTAAASTPSGSRPRRSPTASSPRPSSRR